jgi:hypothetical protein
VKRARGARRDGGSCVSCSFDVVCEYPSYLHGEFPFHCNNVKYLLVIVVAREHRHVLCIAALDLIAVPCWFQFQQMWLPCTCISYAGTQRHEVSRETYL